MLGYHEHKMQTHFLLKLSLSGVQVEMRWSSVGFKSRANKVVLKVDEWFKNIS